MAVHSLPLLEHSPLILLEHASLLRPPPTPPFPGPPTQVDLGRVLDVDPPQGFELTRTATSVAAASRGPTPAMSSAPFGVHLETGGMFAVATRVKRRITVQPNGDALVDEEYTIVRGWVLAGEDGRDPTPA